MCLSCGCCRWTDSHGNPNQITQSDMAHALLANPGMTLRQLFANLYDGMVALLADEEGKNG